MFKKTALLAPLFVLLNACSSLSQNECQIGDWYGIGYRDGLQGRNEAYISNHQKACAKHGIKPLLSDYLSGRKKGLETFCQPDNGYRLGRNGSDYPLVCPEHLQADFLARFESGRDYYQQHQKVRGLEREIRTLIREQESLDEQIAEKEALLISDGLSSEQRADLLLAIRTLEADFPPPELLEQLGFELEQAQQILTGMQ